MNIHQNARLTPLGRERLAKAVLGGGLVSQLARTAGVCTKTARKWAARFAAEGSADMVDRSSRLRRSSRPRRLYRPTPEPVADAVENLRRQRLCGQQIAVETHLSPATVSRILKRRGLSRIRDLEPPEPVRRRVN